MRVIEKTIYQFGELTDAAKEKAREWFRGVAKHVGALIGFEVDRVCWAGISANDRYMRTSVDAYRTDGGGKPA